MIRQNQKFLSQAYAVADFAVLQVAFFLSWWFRFRSGLLDYSASLPLVTYYSVGLLYGLIVIFLGYFLNLYAPKRKRNFSYEAIKVTQVHIAGLLVLLSFLFLFKEIHISRIFLAIFLAAGMLLVWFYRFVLKITLNTLRQKGYNKQFVLIIGAGTLGRRFYNNLLLYPELGFQVVGFLDDFIDAHESRFEGYPPIIGKVDDLETVLQKYVVDEVVVALPLDVHDKYGKIIAVCDHAGVKTMIIPDFFDILPARPYFDNFAGIPLINVRNVPLDDLGNRFVKRMFDIAFSLLVIVVTSPLMTLIALGIKLTSRGPVLFKQERIGFNRRKFTIYKFRTMRMVPKEVSDTEWVAEERSTKLGALLRRLNLDELPQFFNVLKGDMSVVGPRPERTYFVEQFKNEIPRYMIKHYIRPGITGWAQTNGLRGDTSIEDRINHDLFYIENWSFIFDLKIIFKTLSNELFNKKAF